jgi:hypothetical protein
MLVKVQLYQTGTKDHPQLVDVNFLYQITSKSVAVSDVKLVDMTLPLYFSFCGNKQRETRSTSAARLHKRMSKTAKVKNI